MNQLTEQFLNFILQIFNLSIGVITYVDKESGKCKVQLDGLNEVECDIIFESAHNDYDNSMVWGKIDYFSAGDHVIMLLDRGQPYILARYNGYKNAEDMYENGKVNINRIQDSDENLSTTEKAKLQIGEILLRSLGFADIFSDQYGNMILDSSKEFVFRIGDRDANNIISLPETTLRLGKVKDTNGTEKLDSTNKKIKLELIHNTNNKLTLNEDGLWTITNGNSSIVLQPDGKMIINGGSIQVARRGDAIKSNNTLDASFFNFLLSHVHLGVTPGGGVTGIPGAPGPTAPTTLAGDIDAGNPNLLSD